MTEVTSLAYEAYNDAVEQRMEELRSCFGSTEDFRGLAFEDHEEGECVQCDAYRRLSRESDDD